MNIFVKKYLPLAFILCVTLFLSTYKLTESPRTWLDEGIITQVSKNMAEYGKHALQVAPETFVSAGVVSTGYPVTFPISISFRLFGVGILQARSVMVIFILILILSVFFYLKRHYSDRVAFWGTTLVATFSPLYGDGKNVLGEIPGLAFFFILLLFLDRIAEDRNKYINYLLAGVFAGLAFSTKSIFILLLPAFLLVSLWQFYNKKFIWSNSYFISIAGFLFVVLIWIWVQFSGDSLSHILSIYANPYSISILESIKSNLHLFTSELQPIYFILTFIVWLIAVIIRIRKKLDIDASELLAFTFSFLVFLAFFRTPGFYRYFFLAQFLTLVYLLPSLNYIFDNTRLAKYITFGIGVLIVFHTYQSAFNSWVATYYNGTRSEQIALHVADIPKNKKIIFYQVPEFIIFLHDNNYYQYIDIAPQIKVGETNLELVKKGFFDEIFINNSVYSEKNPLFKLYSKRDEFDSYAVLERI